MTARKVRVPSKRVWLRVASPEWTDPLDPSFARRHGGRWNPPGSYPVLHLNGDVLTARVQVERMLAGSPVMIDDLDDDAFGLVAATLPGRPICADAVTNDGLRALGLPVSYPRDDAGDEIDHPVCQAVGRRVHRAGLRGLWCRSAVQKDGHLRELAWFPANHRIKAQPVWSRPLPFGAWRHAVTWNDLGIEAQPDPEVA